jgi:hypothetical protein
MDQVLDLIQEEKTKRFNRNDSKNLYLIKEFYTAFLIEERKLLCRILNEWMGPLYHTLLPKLVWKSANEKPAVMLDIESVYKSSPNKYCNVLSLVTLQLIAVVTSNYQ